MRLEIHLWRIGNALSVGTNQCPVVLNTLCLKFRVHKCEVFPLSLRQIDQFLDLCGILWMTVVFGLGEDVIGGNREIGHTPESRTITRSESMTVGIRCATLIIVQSAKFSLMVR